MAHDRHVANQDAASQADGVGQERGAAFPGSPKLRAYETCTLVAGQISAHMGHTRLVSDVPIDMNWESMSGAFVGMVSSTQCSCAYKTLQKVLELASAHTLAPHGGSSEFKVWYCRCALANA